MISEELSHKIATLEIKTRRVINSSVLGQYRSLFKGQGLSFSDLRPYIEGDDTRLIDWKVTARERRPYIKLFEEERELNVFILLDISGSSIFGSGDQSKRDFASEIAAILGFSAAKSNDRVGLLLFTDKVELYRPAKRGRKHMMSLLSDIYSYQATGKKTSISNALQYLSKVTKKSSLIFLLSDFMDAHLGNALKIAARKHELMPIVLEDPKELSLPKAGLLSLEDPETGAQIVINTWSKDTRLRFKTMVLARKFERDRLFKAAALFPLELRVGATYITKLRQYFSWRLKQKSQA